METENDTGLRINDKPDVMFNATYFDNSFVSVPLIRGEIEGRNELLSDIVKQRGKVSAQVGNSGLGKPDIMKHQSNLS